MPPLNWLRAFEAAARYASFKHAAEELNVTPAAISQQIRSLEEFYDVRLFHRKTRALELTRIGKMAAPLMSKALDSFTEACTLIRDDTHRDWLTLTAPFTFCMKWLMPRLEQFNEEYPKVEIRINATDELIDLNQGDADIGIRYGNGDYPGMEVYQLMSGTYRVVANPDFVENNNGLRCVSEIKELPLLHTDWRGSPNFVPSWEMWLKSAKISVADLSTSKGHKFSNEMMTIDAAVSGMGIALVSHANCENDLNEGRLVEVFEDVDFSANQFAYYIVKRKFGASSHNTEVLCDWLRKIAQSRP